MCHFSRRHLLPVTATIVLACALTIHAAPVSFDIPLELTLNAASNAEFTMDYDGETLVQTSDLVGLLDVTLQVEVDPLARTADVTGITFDDGTWLSDQDEFVFSAGATVWTVGIGGTFSTAAPPVPVTPSGTFDGSLQQAGVDRGLLVSTGAFSTLYNFADNAFQTNGLGTGQITWQKLLEVGDIATYEFDLDWAFPASVTILGLDSGGGPVSLQTDIAASVVTAKQSTSLLIPEPSAVLLTILIVTILGMGVRGRI